MGRPGSMCRQFIILEDLVGTNFEKGILGNDRNYKEVVGISLGQGGFFEHNITSLEDLQNWCLKINSVPDFGMLNSKVLKELKKDEKKDITYLKKLRKKEESELFYQLSPFVLRRNIPTYRRSIKIDNSENKFNIKALEDGDYIFFGIEGGFLKEYYKRYFNTTKEGRRKFNESELLQSRDYQSVFTTSGGIMCDYEVNSPQLFLLVNKKYEDIIDTLEKSIRVGYCALCLQPKNGVPCLLFVDRVLGRSVVV